MCYSFIQLFSAKLSTFLSELNLFSQNTKKHLLFEYLFPIFKKFLFVNFLIHQQLKLMCSIKNCHFTIIEKKIIFHRIFWNFFGKIIKGGMFSSKWAIHCQFWERIVDSSLMLEKSILKWTPCIYLSECMNRRSVKENQNNVKNTFKRLFTYQFKFKVSKTLRNEVFIY